MTNERGPYLYLYLYLHLYLYMYMYIYMGIEQLAVGLTMPPLRGVMGWAAGLKTRLNFRGHFGSSLLSTQASLTHGRCGN